MPIYATLILFLLFLIKLSEKCNVTWSFYIFESMTGLPHLLGEDAQCLLERVPEKCDSDHDLIHYDPLKADILKLAMSVIKDDCDAPLEGCELVYFVRFLANIRDEIEAGDSVAGG